jgi:hypothetical protein
VQSGTLEAATGRPRGLRREHPDGSVDASLGGGPALPVGSVAALEQPLDEHELVPAVEFQRVVTTSASASTAALRTGTIARHKGIEAVAVCREAHRAQRLGPDVARRRGVRLVDGAACTRALSLAVARFERVLFVEIPEVGPVRCPP